MTYESNLDYAQKQDQTDPLKSFRSNYHIPPHGERTSIYFCGNSLGLQPISTKSYIDQELENWKTKGVEGHFTGENPWVGSHLKFKDPLAKLVGARPMEVTCMNNLTTNLHLLIASFYKPEGKRRKILIEGGAFPSDHYAAESHMRHLGIDPKQHLEIIYPKEGEIFTTEEITSKIKEIGDELALVLFPGIQYYTGQFFDMKSITEAVHAVGAYAGFDLAHAIGNLPMSLHDDGIDFATWCSYKYLNSGPGGVSGIFVHENHCANPNFHKLTGWWGHDLSSRFEMDNQFVPNAGADAWMLSNGNIISAAAHFASLDIFMKTSMDQLRAKSIHLTGYLEYLLISDEAVASNIKILTPSDPSARGCQLSIYIHEHGKSIHTGLMDAGVILDWREPNVIRVAPTPMYNTFSEVYEFYLIFKQLIEQYA